MPRPSCTTPPPVLDGDRIDEPGPADGTSATLLPDGRVLEAGGPGASAELYDPAAGSGRHGRHDRGRGWPHRDAPARRPCARRRWPRQRDRRLASAQLYDPVTGSWTATAALTTARIEGRAVLLPDGTVLVVGGSSSNNGMALAAAEVYQP